MIRNELLKDIRRMAAKWGLIIVISSPYLSLIDAPQPAHLFSVDADSVETRSFNILISPLLLSAPLHSRCYCCPSVVAAVPLGEGGQSIFPRPGPGSIYS